MKYLIVLLYLLLAIHLSAQEYVVIDQIVAKYTPEESAMTSIMFQKPQHTFHAPQWNKGLAKRKKRVISKNTTKGMLLGAIGGGLVMLPVQLVSDALRAFSIWETREVEPRYGLVGIGATLGGIMGGIKGNRIGQEKAERLEYEEFLEQARSKARK